MGVLRMTDLLAFFGFGRDPEPRGTPETRGFGVAQRIYNETKGPTPELRKMYNIYLSNKAGASGDQSATARSKALKP